MRFSFKCSLVVFSMFDFLYLVEQCLICCNVGLKIMASAIDA